MHELSRRASWVSGHLWGSSPRRLTWGSLAWRVIRAEGESK